MLTAPFAFPASDALTRDVTRRAGRARRWSVLLFAFGLFLGANASGQAQDAAARTVPSAELRSLAAFWELTAGEREQPRAISIECDVLYYDSAWGMLWVRDASATSYVVPGSQPLPISSGQRVRVHGTLTPADGQISFEGTQIEVLGAAAMEPTIVGTRVDQINRFNGDFVQIDGLVDQQTQIDRKHLQLVVLAGGKPLVVWVMIAPDAARPDFVGSTIRVRGVFVGSSITPQGEFGSLQLWVPGAERIDVLSHLEDDPRFDIPVVAVRDLVRQPAGTRVRVVGEANIQLPDRSLRLRDATGQVNVISLQSMSVRPGETIEAIGIPAAQGFQLRLEDAIFRPMRVRTQPQQPAPSPEEPAPGPPPIVPARTIRTLGEFWLLTSEERRQPLAFDLECNVLHYDADPTWNQLWVRDETAGAYVYPGNRPLPIKAGQRIRVTGTCPETIEHLSFASATIVVVGEAPIVPLPLGDWTNFNPELSDQVVWAEGLVDRQTTSATDLNHFRLFLTVDGRLVVAWILVQPGAPLPDLVGSIVRVSGIYNPQPKEPGPLARLELMVSGLDHVEVIGRLATDPRFQRPAMAIDQLRDLPPDVLVRVVGQVNSQQAGRSIQVRDATGQVDVVSSQTTVMAVHEPVEAIGWPRVDGINVRLEGGMFRRLVSPEAGSPERAPAVVAPETLHLAANVLELSPEDADLRHPAQITGVVTWAHPSYPYFFMQDSSGGVRVQRGPDPKEVAKTGRSIEAGGVTHMGLFAPEVVADRLERIGVVALPEAPMISLDHALTGVAEAQWVAMRGYLHAVESRVNELGLEEQILQLATATGDFEAVVPTHEDLTPMLGAILRVRGVCTARADAHGKLTGVQVRVSDASFLQIEEPAPSDVFDLPLRSLASLGRFATTQAFNRRVKVEGTVLHASAGRFVIHEGGASLMAMTREKNPPRAGDRIEAVGFLGRQGSRVVMRETVHRDLGAGEMPRPVQLSEVDVVNPVNDSQLVRITGTVLDSSYVGSTLGMTVRRGTAVFPAYLDGMGVDVEKNSIVELTGVYDVRFDEYGQPRSFGLLLRDGTDLVVVARPSWFTARRVLGFTAVLALITAVVVAWVVALRRRVQLQTEQIREQLQRESRLQGELERALRLESLGLLAGGIAHDFNNLLTVVMGNISLARFDPGLDAENRASLGEAELAVARARDLTHQLLTFSKGGAPIRAAVDLAGVVREVAQFVLHGSNVRPEFHFAPGLWPADVDKGQIGQVVQNIVINGAQAMQDGGSIDIALGNVDVKPGESAALEPGRYLFLEVTDHGRGIAPEELPRIFDPYFTTKRQGSGLGLATVYSIVKRHNGEITVDSTLGVGTTFRVHLPAAQSDPATASSAAAPSVIETPRRSEARADRVLIMDDEESIRRLTQTILRRAGYETACVADGAEALREYVAAREAGRPYDLVIFDLTVPGGMGGRQAMEELLKIDPNVKAIVSSGYSNDPTLSDHRALGFAAMVAKPYEVAVLLEAVRGVLDGRSP